MPRPLPPSTPRDAPPPRVVARVVRPLVEGALVKRVVGEPITVEAVALVDGAERLHLVLAHRSERTRSEHLVPMTPSADDPDRWRAAFTSQEPGPHRFRVMAWIDRYATWAEQARTAIDAGADPSEVLAGGVPVLERLATGAPGRLSSRLAGAAARLARGDVGVLHETGAHAVDGLAHLALRPGDAVSTAEVEVLVEPARALAATWARRTRAALEADGGGLRAAAGDLGAYDDLGVDIVLLGPVQPLDGGSDPDVPSIGGANGGHDVVDPSLGTIQDLEALATAAADASMALGLELSLRCSPAHPWVRHHPEWFRHLPDGTVRLELSGPSWREVWGALRDVLVFWIDRGVRAFRVLDPSDAPLPFWRWALAEVRAVEPGVVVLAGHDDRPDHARELARAGFTQCEVPLVPATGGTQVVGALRALAGPDWGDLLRPTCWLPWSGRGGHPDGGSADDPAAGPGPAAVLGALCCPSVGLDEADVSSAVHPTLGEILRLHRQQAALRTLRTLRFHRCSTPGVVVCSKAAPGGPVADPDRPGDATVLMVVDLVGDAAQQVSVGVHLEALGVGEGEPWQAVDLLTGDVHDGDGERLSVPLDPSRGPAFVARVAQA